MPGVSQQHRDMARDYYEKSKRALKNLSDFDAVGESQFPGTDQPSRFRWADLKKFPKKNMPSHTALIFGDRHIMTFDGKVYAIPESGDQKCTYLLARGE